MANTDRLQSLTVLQQGGAMREGFLVSRLNKNCYIVIPYRDDRMNDGVGIGLCVW